MPPTSPEKARTAYSVKELDASPPAIPSVPVAEYFAMEMLSIRLVQNTALLPSTSFSSMSASSSDALALGRQSRFAGAAIRRNTCVAFSGHVACR